MDLHNFIVQKLNKISTTAFEICILTKASMIYNFRDPFALFRVLDLYAEQYFVYLVAFLKQWRLKYYDHRCIFELKYITLCQFIMLFGQTLPDVNVADTDIDAVCSVNLRLFLGLKSLGYTNANVYYREYDMLQSLISQGGII